MLFLKTKSPFSPPLAFLLRYVCVCLSHNMKTEHNKLHSQKKNFEITVLVSHWAVDERHRQDMLRPARRLWHLKEYAQQGKLKI